MIDLDSLINATPSAPAPVESATPAQVALMRTHADAVPNGTFTITREGKAPSLEACANIFGKEGLYEATKCGDDSGRVCSNAARFRVVCPIHCETMWSLRKDGDEMEELLMVIEFEKDCLEKTREGYRTLRATEYESPTLERLRCEMISRFSETERTLMEEIETLEKAVRVLERAKGKIAEFARYYDPRRPVCASCLPHGDCPWCQSNRHHKNRRRAVAADCQVAAYLYAPERD